LTVDASPHPFTIRLETPDYIVRTIEPDDNFGDWGEWLTDPMATRNLNARPSRLSEEELRAYIARFDRQTSHLLGIFAKDVGRLVGIRAVYIDVKSKEFLVNVLVGAADARNKGARSQSRTVVYRYFFEEAGLETARASVLAANEAVRPSMEKRGWVHEHTDYKPAASGEGFVELHHFRLSRERWRDHRW